MLRSVYDDSATMGTTSCDKERLGPRAWSRITDSVHWPGASACTTLGEMSMDIVEVVVTPTFDWLG